VFIRTVVIATNLGIGGDVGIVPGVAAGVEERLILARDAGEMAPYIAPNGFVVAEGAVSLLGSVRLHQLKRGVEERRNSPVEEAAVGAEVLIKLVVPARLVEEMLRVRIQR
jgi:hypothetical protein